MRAVVPTIVLASLIVQGCSLYPTVQDPAVVPATNKSQILANLAKYRDADTKKSTSLQRTGYVFQDVALLGGLVAVGGGIAESSSVAIGGGALSALASIPPSRYQLSVQAANYRKAGNAMRCMYDVIFPMRESEVNAIGVPTINKLVANVRSRLADAQAAVKLIDPDLDALRTSIEKQNESEDLKDQADVALQPKGVRAEEIVGLILAGAESNNDEAIKSRTTTMHQLDASVLTPGVMLTLRAAATRQAEGDLIACGAN